MPGRCCGEGEGTTCRRGETDSSCLGGDEEGANRCRGETDAAGRLRGEIE